MDEYNKQVHATEKKNYSELLERLGSPEAPSFHFLCERVGTIRPGTSAFIASVTNPGCDPLLANSLSASGRASRASEYQSMPIGSVLSKSSIECLEQSSVAERLEQALHCTLFE